MRSGRTQWSVVLEPQPDEHADPEQQMQLITVDCEQQKINRAHPEQRLERVHGKARRVVDDYRRSKYRQACQENSEALATEFPRDQAGKQDFAAQRQRWQ